MRVSALSLFSLLSFSLAHEEPKSDEEREIQRSLQAAAYHVRAILGLSYRIDLFSLQCAPAVAEFTAARKRSWAQKVLGGMPSLGALPGYSELFAGDSDDPVLSSGQETFMSCVPSAETRIENNTCVLSTSYKSAIILPSSR
jgi:hypothetical protein